LAEFYFDQYSHEFETDESNVAMVPRFQEIIDEA